MSLPVAVFAPAPAFIRRAWSAIFVVFACAWGTELSGQDLTESTPARGPLALAERNPLYDLFYIPVGASADGLAAGQTQVDIGFGYSNIFERSETPTHSQLFDLERLSTTVTVRYALTGRFEAGGRLTVHSSWGGFLDPLIEGIHGAFGVSNGERDRAEQGQYTLLLRERDGTVLFNARQRGFAPADLQLFGRAQIAGGAQERFALAARTTLKLPTGVEGTNTGRVDLATELLGRWSAGSWHWHGMLGATTVRAPEELADLSRGAAVLLGAAVERTLGRAVSVIIQAQSSSRYVAGIGEDELDDFPLIVGFGVAGSRESWTWQAAFVEDIPPNGPSADVTLHFQFSRRWE